MTHTMDVEIEGTGGASISGVGVFDVEVQYVMASDTGGSDGVQITGCEFTHVELSGLNISTHDICRMIGPSGIESLEDAARVEVEINIKAGVI